MQHLLAAIKITQNLDFQLFQFPICVVTVCIDLTLIGNLNWTLADWIKAGESLKLPKIFYSTLPKLKWGSTPITWPA